MFVQAFALLLAVAAAGQDPARRTEGVDGFCQQAAKSIGPQLGQGSFAFQLTAEGSALELVDALTGRCQAHIAEGHTLLPASAADRLVRLRVRAAPPLLVGVVELVALKGPKPEVLYVETVEAPASGALATWMSAGGTGLETWLAGSVEGEVLAMCGDDGDGDGVAEVALVTATQLQVLRWGTSGLDPVAKADLPPALRPRARALGATLSCRASEGGLSIALGVHDRNRGATLRYASGALSSFTLVDGVPLGFAATGELVTGEGVVGTGLVRWQGQSLAAAAVVAGKTPRVVGATQEGALLTADAPGRPYTVGAGVAVGDVDRNGTPDVVHTRPVFAGPDATDRIVVAPLEQPASARHESPALRGALGALGAVQVGDWVRVLAAQTSQGTTRLYALGRRLPPGGRP